MFVYDSSGGWTRRFADEIVRVIRLQWALDSEGGERTDSSAHSPMGMTPTPEGDELVS